ncbi:MAG: hypothetical protein GX892_08330 [Thermoanaerobacteraceae bacterium]|nr:hypothetical protein [Thermoanaerobacteraceae bacterium]
MEKQHFKISGSNGYVDELDITNIMLGLEVAIKDYIFFGFGVSAVKKVFARGGR